MTETVPFSEAKAHLSDLADRVEREHDRVLVTRNGRPSFVLISPDDLDALEETLDITADEELLLSGRHDENRPQDRPHRCAVRSDSASRLLPPVCG